MSASKDNSINQSLFFQDISGFLLSCLKQLDSKTSITYLTLGSIFITSLILFPVYLTGNEENIFMVSHKSVQPELFPEFHAILEKSNARLIPELLFGNLVKGLGYELAHTVARLSMILIYSVSLAVFFNAVGISLLSSILALSIFHITGEFIVGQDWLFKGVETKTIAYAGVIAALGFAIRRLWTIAIFLSIIATYFHFLVGGFWAMALIFLCWLQGQDKPFMRNLFLLYICAVTPLILMIFVDQYGADTSSTTIDPEYIYAVRSVHHAAPFLITFKFFQEWLPGFALAAILYYVMQIISQNSSHKYFANFVKYLLAYLFFALFLSYLDRETLTLSKFFMFRPSALIWLLTITIVITFVRENFSENKKADKAWLVLMLVALPLIITPIIRKKIREFIILEQNTLAAEVGKIIKLNSNPNEVTLLDPSTELATVSFQRKISRPFLVKRKFVPVHPEALITWKERIDFRNEVFKNGCTKKMAYPVKLLFALNHRMDDLKSCGEVIWKSKKYHIVKIDSKFHN